MTFSSGQNGTAPRRGLHVAILVLGIIILVSIWLGGWYFSASAVDERSQTLIENLERNGVVLDCRQRRVAGFPFRVGIFCDDVAVSLPDGSRARAGAFRSAAQFYAPGKIVAELDGPAELEQRGNVPLLIAWSDLRASARADLNTINQLSLTANELEFRDGWAPDAPAMAMVGSVTVHARRTGEKEADGQLAFEARSLKPAGGTYPGLNLAGNIVMEDFAALQGQDFDLQQLLGNQGLALEVGMLRMSPEDGGLLELSGPVKVHGTGLVDGTITIRLAEIDRLVEFIGMYLPDQSDFVGQIAAIIRGVAAKPTGEDKQDYEAEIRLNVEQNKVSVGLIPIGRIPPLF